PLARLQFSDDAAIVGVASGQGRDVARDRPRYALGHSGASYQARATCDSETVTRIAARALPSRPSPPARAAWARQAWMWCARNSGVVLRPAKFGCESRVV